MLRPRRARVGRTAEAATDVVMKAEILSYSRAKGCSPASR